MNGNCSSQAAFTSVCDAIDAAILRDIVVVAAAGNNLSLTGFPARRPDVVSVGGIFGLDEFGAPRFWTFAGNCPPLPPPFEPGDECGSNYRTGAGSGVGWDFIQYVAPAVSLPSPMVPAFNWNNYIACGDSFSGLSNDGFGPCTGTSMSTPQVSAIFGVLRSINPMLEAGSTWTPASGIKGLVRQTSSRVVAGLPNHYQLGFGLPNGAVAAQKLLGNIAGQAGVNRVTPLFHLYSPERDDYAAVATPQMAVALMGLDHGPYRSERTPADTFIEGSPVTGYSDFPVAKMDKPRALSLVMTTDRVRDGLPTPTPLFVMAWPRAQAVGADDYILVTGEMIQTLANAGYSYAGRQGYIFPWCGDVNCAPTGTEALHLKCKHANDPVARRCTIFPESKRGLFELESYTSFFPGAPQHPLGFAFSVDLDLDNDDLLDGAEILAGMSTEDIDSDGDGISDVVEYPFAGLPASDPCQGPFNHCPAILLRVFRDGFE